MQHSKLSKETINFILRTVNNAVQDNVTTTPIAMGLLIVRLTSDLTQGALNGIVSEAYVKVHVQEAIMYLIARQRIWATIQTVGDRCDTYLMQPICGKQHTYNYEV